MNSKHLHELMDACRPGSDDLAQPELIELAGALSQDLEVRQVFSRSQEFDASIRTAFQSVVPPAGLAERLLEAMDKLEAQPVVDDDAPRVEVAKRGSRRWFAIGAGTLSLAGVAAAVAILLSNPQTASTLSAPAVAERVDRWNAKLTLRNWQSISNAPSQDFPIWQRIELRNEDRWQWVTNHRILCYDIAVDTQENGEIVRLFVSEPVSSETFPTTPPAGYPSPTAGWHVGAWQAQGRVYYLAVYAPQDSKFLYSRVIGARVNSA